MPGQRIAIKSTGLVTSVGLSAPAACAAIRAKISNPTETRFMGSDGEWIMAHQVPLEQPWRGRTKLAKMAAMAISECLDGISNEDWPGIPLLLCVAEHERPGRLEGLDDRLFLGIENELGKVFAPESGLIAAGRVSVAIALSQARKLIYEGNKPRVLIAATDSLLTWPTLSVYEREDRLLTAGNSNGFIPGEAGGALLVGRPDRGAELLCAGVGFGVEKAHIESGEPLRADGLATAIRGALADAGCEFHDLDYRITDLSGEQYHFKEAALALSRILRQRKEEFDIWHPSECCGEIGAAAGICSLAVASSASQKSYAPGSNVLIHFSSDAGPRAVAVLRTEVANG
jgi:3-oxoacyl-[acyl-carrier-protein] synthase-1